MTLGGKYKWKPLNDNPPPGLYNIEDSIRKVNNITRSVLIKKDTSSFRRPPEKLPEPGQYDKYINTTT